MPISPTARTAPTATLAALVIAFITHDASGCTASGTELRTVGSNAVTHPPELPRQGIDVGIIGRVGIAQKVVQLQGVHHQVVVLPPSQGAGRGVVALGVLPVGVRIAFHGGTEESALLKYSNRMRERGGAESMD